MSERWRMKAQWTSLYFFLYLFSVADVCAILFNDVFVLKFHPTEKKVFGELWVHWNTDLFLPVSHVYRFIRRSTIRQIPTTHPLLLIRGDEWRSFRLFLRYVLHDLPDEMTTIRYSKTFRRRFLVISARAIA